MSWSEQRRLDKAADREQDREDRRLAIEGRLEAERLRAEEKRKDAAEKRRLEQLDRKTQQQEKDRRKAARAERYATLRTTLTAKSVEVFVGSVMAAALVPAFISQAAFLRAAGLALPLACLAAAAVEGATWAFTAMAAKAEKEHRPTGRLRAGTWACALFAGALNLAHWTATHGPVVGVFFGILTPLATLLWDWRTHTSTRTKEQRADARARARHERKRRKDHKPVVKVAERLVSAAPFGALAFEDAFAAAWEIRHGTRAAGLTPELHLEAARSHRSLTQALAETGMSAEAAEVELFLADLFGPGRPDGGDHGGASARGGRPPKGPAGGTGTTTTTAPEKGAQGSASSQVGAHLSPRTKPTPPKRRKGDSPKFSPLARKAASREAKDRQSKP